MKTRSGQCCIYKRIPSSNLLESLADFTFDPLFPDLLALKLISQGRHLGTFPQWPLGRINALSFLVVRHFRNWIGSRHGNEWSDVIRDESLFLPLDLAFDSYFLRRMSIFPIPNVFALKKSENEGEKSEGLGKSLFQMHNKQLFWNARTKNWTNAAQCNWGETHHTISPMFKLIV